MKDIRSDLEKYTDQWEKALKDGVFDDAPKSPSPRHTDWFGHSTSASETEINDEEAEYWKQMMDEGGEELIQEENEPTKDQLKKMNSRLANSHNPVHPDNLGNDQDVIVNQNWAVGGKEIEELAEMKVKLEELESRLNADEAMLKPTVKVTEQIKNLKKQIDELSNSLNGNRMGDSTDRLAQS
jgi:protein subunit release factor A